MVGEWQILTGNFKINLQINHLAFPKRYSCSPLTTVDLYSDIYGAAGFYPNLSEFTSKKTLTDVLKK